MQNEGERNVRVQILIPPASAERLDKLVTETESTSAAEVVRNALRLYEAVIDAEKTGRPFFQRIDGVMVPVLMMGPYAPPVRKSMVFPIMTREEFDRSDRRRLRDGLACIVTDPPALRHFTDGEEPWIEERLVRDEDIDVSTFQEGEVRGDVNAVIVRIGSEGWRTQSGGRTVEPIRKRIIDVFRRRT